MAVNGKNHIVGVGSIQPAENNAMRIRYMAVTQELRDLGIGSAIVKRLLAYALRHQVSRCWLYARSNAIGFYKKQQFTMLGEIDTELPVAHFKMEISFADGDDSYK